MAKIVYIYTIIKANNTMNYFTHNYRNLLTATLALLLAYSLGTGAILKYVTFTDPLGEMVLFLVASLTTIFSLATLTNKK